MLWLMRDTGLSIFLCGSLLFVLSRIRPRTLNLPDAASLRSISDLMMLSGACLAVTAMALGFFASSGSPQDAPEKAEQGKVSRSVVLCMQTPTERLRSVAATNLHCQAK